MDKYDQHLKYCRLLEAVKLIELFLEDCYCTSGMCYDEQNRIVMCTDIGYFNEGLYDLKEYLDDMTIITGE